MRHQTYKHPLSGFTTECATRRTNTHSRDSQHNAPPDVPTSTLGIRNRMRHQTPQHPHLGFATECATRRPNTHTWDSQHNAPPDVPTSTLGIRNRMRHQTSQHPHLGSRCYKRNAVFMSFISYLLFEIKI